MHARRSRSRGCAGQAIVETVLAVMLLCLIFFALLQIAVLYMSQMVADHTAYVTARSYVVGYELDVVQRASEVGSIPMAGNITQPVAYSQMSPAQLSALEPMLIEEFLQTNGYTMWYEHWGRIREDLPILNGEGMAEIGIYVNDYPLQMPMHRAYMSGDTVDFHGRMRLLNHAGYYLE